MVTLILTPWDTGCIQYIRVYKVLNPVPVTEQLNGSYYYVCDNSAITNTWRVPAFFPFSVSWGRFRFSSIVCLSLSSPLREGCHAFGFLWIRIKKNEREGQRDTVTKDRWLKTQGLTAQVSAHGSAVTYRQAPGGWVQLSGSVSDCELPGLGSRV